MFETLGYSKGVQRKWRAEERKRKRGGEPFENPPYAKFDFQNSLMRWIFSKWGKWGLERKRILPKITQIGNGVVRISSQVCFNSKFCVFQTIPGTFPSGLEYEIWSHVLQTVDSPLWLCELEGIFKLPEPLSLTYRGARNSHFRGLWWQLYTMTHVEVLCKC